MSKPTRRARRVSLLVVLVSLAACEAPVGGEQVEFRVPVAVETVSLATFEDKVVTTGTLRAPEIVSLTVMSRGLLEILAQGRKGRFAEGDAVKRGQQIALITGEDVRLAARHSAARQRLDTARKNLEAAITLFDKGALTDNELGGLRDVYEESKLEYDRALHTEEANKIVTPIDGVIVTLARDEKGQNLANGQLVEPGDVIAQVAPMDTLVADVDVVGQDIAKARVGLEARVHYHAWKGRSFAGEVLRLAPTIDERTRALRAEVEIDNAEGLLRPGMFVQVALINEVRADVPRVPRRALTERGGQSVVFVLEGQRVRQREVNVGFGDDDWIEIRKGVKAGDQVIVQGLETLIDQMPVRVTGNQ